MVGRLVAKQQARPLRHREGCRQPHLLPTRQRAHRPLQRTPPKERASRRHVRGVGRRLHLVAVLRPLAAPRLLLLLLDPRVVFVDQKVVVRWRPADPRPHLFRSGGIACRARH
eukprot:6072716-Prymnesium_polylepis.1